MKTPTITKLRLPKGVSSTLQRRQAPPPSTKTLARQPNYTPPQKEELADVEGWTLVPFTRKLHEKSVLDRERASRYALYGIEVFKNEEGNYVVTFGGPDNVFVEVEEGTAAVGIASAIYSLVIGERSDAIITGKVTRK